MQTQHKLSLMFDMQAHRHAPGLKVVVYDGMSKVAKDEEQESRKQKSKQKSFKKMSREEKFKTSAVSLVLF